MAAELRQHQAGFNAGVNTALSGWMSTVATAYAVDSGKLYQRFPAAAGACGTVAEALGRYWPKLEEVQSQVRKIAAEIAKRRSNPAPDSNTLALVAQADTCLADLDTCANHLAAACRGAQTALTGAFADLLPVGQQVAEAKSLSGQIQAIVSKDVDTYAEPETVGPALTVGDKLVMDPKLTPEAEKLYGLTADLGLYEMSAGVSLRPGRDNGNDVAKISQQVFLAARGGLGYAENSAAGSGDAESTQSYNPENMPTSDAKPPLQSLFRKDAKGALQVPVESRGTPQHMFDAEIRQGKPEVDSGFLMFPGPYSLDKTGVIPHSDPSANAAAAGNWAISRAWQHWTNLVAPPPAALWGLRDIGNWWDHLVHRVSEPSASADPWYGV